MGAALLCAAALAQAQAQSIPQSPPQSSDFTPLATLERLFAVEGAAPYPQPYAGTLVFSALASKYDSGHGHGYRNELKLAEALRRPASATREHFHARVTPTLADGARTIVAQYHVEGLDTLLKVYVQDSADAAGLDGRAGNGVFDILVRVRGRDGRESATALGTVRSGAAFDLDIVLADGAAAVTVRGPDGARRTAAAPVALDGRTIYFKFGDYLQALDPVTGAHTTSAAAWDAYYRAHRIDASRVEFAGVVFEHAG